MNKHTEGRTEVSTSKWLFGLAAQVFLSVIVIGSVYALNAGRFEYSGFVALGGVVAVIYFSSLASGRPGKIITGLMKLSIAIFTMIVLTVEIFSMAANYMASSAGSDLDQYRSIKQNAISKQAEIKQEKEDIKNGTMTDAQKAYHIRLKDKASEKYDVEANMVIDSNQSKVFSDFNKWLGVNNSEGLYRAILSALAIIALPLIMSSRNQTWCGLTLWIYNRQQASLKKLLNPAEEITETKNDSDEDGENQGLGDKEPKRKPKSMGDYEAAKSWVEREFISGGYIGAEHLKKATGTTAPHQQKAIISELIKNKIVEKKGKAVKKYYRTEAKDQALGVMSQTAKLFKFAQVK